MLTVIEDYADIIVDNKVTDAPREFIESSMIMLISSLAGRAYRFHFGPEMSLGIVDDIGLGGLMLNVWMKFIGPTRSSRKSTVLGKIKLFLDKYVEGRLIPTSFTLEALIKQMDDMCEDGETNAIWFADEIGRFYRNLKKKRYMTAADTFLSQVYSGDSFTRSTITRGDEKVLNPYVTTLLAGTIDVPRHFSEYQLRQGFLNRFIFVCAEREHWFAPNEADVRAAGEALQEKVTPWLETFHAISQTKDFVSLTYSDTAWELWEEMAKGIDDESRGRGLGIYSGWVGEMPNYIIKLSAIHKLASLSQSELDDIFATITVEKEHYKWAYNYMQDRYDDFREIVRLMRTTPETETPTTDARELETVLSEIRKAISRRTKEDAKDLYVSDEFVKKTHRYATHEEVQNATGIKRKTLAEDIGSLADGGNIIIGKIGKHTAGRPKTVYVLPEDIEDDEEDEDEEEEDDSLDWMEL